MLLVRKLISGGQTGGDQGALFAGRDLKLTTGGTAPAGWRTDEGPAPWLADFGLVQHASSSYPPRTKSNVADSDGTFIFGNQYSPGCKLTKRLCQELGKPFFVVTWSHRGGLVQELALRKALTEFRFWLGEEEIEVLNGAGNRERSQPGICKASRSFLVLAIGGE